MLNASNITGTSQIQQALKALLIMTSKLITFNLSLFSLQKASYLSRISKYSDSLIWSSVVLSAIKGYYLLVLTSNQITYLSKRIASSSAKTIVGSLSNLQNLAFLFCKSTSVCLVLVSFQNYSIVFSLQVSITYYTVFPKGFGIQFKMSIFICFSI